MSTVIPSSMIVPCRASVYITPLIPPMITYSAMMAEKRNRAVSYPMPNCCARYFAAPISTAEAYNGMKMKISAPDAPWMNRDWNRRPSSSGNVWASRRRPISRVRPPKNTKAIKMPKKMLRNVNQSKPMPKTPAAPPNPTMAEVLMNVAP